MEQPVKYQVRLKTRFLSLFSLKNKSLLTFFTLTHLFFLYQKFLIEFYDIKHVENYF